MPTMKDTRFVWLYLQSHQTIFNSVIELSRRGTPADLLTITDFLKAQDLLEAVGGIQYLSSLVDTVPSSVNITAYAKIVREKAMYRRIISAGTSMIEEAYSGKIELNDMLDKVEKDIMMTAITISV